VPATNDDDDDNYSDDEDLEYDDAPATQSNQAADNLPKARTTDQNSNVNASDRVKGKGFEAAALFMDQDLKSQASIAAQYIPPYQNQAAGGNASASGGGGF